MTGADQQVLAAWVSAGAAVVQAIAAAVAIWYSGKLARDSAAREKAADEANARRIDEANAAAAEQRRLDHEAALADRRLAQMQEFNEPIVLALGYAEQALGELRTIRQQEQDRAAANWLDLHFQDGTPTQSLILDQFPTLVARARDARSAAAIRHVMDAFSLLPGSRTSQDWARDLGRKVGIVELAVRGLRDVMIPADRNTDAR